MSTKQASFSLRRIAIPAFGPSLLYGIGNGAILPVIVLSAIELGASVALAGLVAALIGIGSLISNIPAAYLATRFGERHAMIGAALFGMLALVLCALAPNVVVLGLGILMVGMAGSVFMLARQAYVIEAVPASMLARAMSTLAGIARIGTFIGPLLGAGVIHYVGLAGAYWLATVCMLGAGAIAYAAPDLESPVAASLAGARAPGLASIARSHHRVFLTLGLGALLVSALRAARPVIIPLWALHLGLAPTMVSLIYGVVAAIDMLMFYPAGKLMDERGRFWVALPCTVLMGASFLLIPFTQATFAFVVVVLVLGFGNGLGSGIIMTLAADNSPSAGRRQFLGLWRLMSDIGSSGGPVLVSAATALVSLSAGIGLIGVLGFVAAGIFWRWIPRGVARSDTAP